MNDTADAVGAKLDEILETLDAGKRADAERLRLYDERAEADEKRKATMHLAQLDALERDAERTRRDEEWWPRARAQQEASIAALAETPTLRDRFAMAALAHVGGPALGPGDMAERAYRVADLILTARAAKPEAP